MLALATTLVGCPDLKTGTANTDPPPPPAVDLIAFNFVIPEDAAGNNQSLELYDTNGVSKGSYVVLTSLRGENFFAYGALTQDKKFATTMLDSTGKMVKLFEAMGTEKILLIPSSVSAKYLGLYVLRPDELGGAQVTCKVVDAQGADVSTVSGPILDQEGVVQSDGLLVLTNVTNEVWVHSTSDGKKLFKIGEFSNADPATNIEDIKVSNNLVVYRTEDNILHARTSDDAEVNIGNPKVTNEYNYAVSEGFLTYKDSNKLLHLLDGKGKALVKPIAPYQGKYPIFISNKFAAGATKVAGGEEMLAVWDSTGKNILESLPSAIETAVISVPVVSDKYIGYFRYTEDALHVLDGTGTEVYHKKIGEHGKIERLFLNDQTLLWKEADSNNVPGFTRREPFRVVRLGDPSFEITEIHTEGKKLIDGWRPFWMPQAR